MELKTSFKFSEIKNIIHISDLHIKNHSRTEEFKHVFQNFINIIKTHTNCVICITGDIFDSYTISHQSIDLFIDFISKCSKLFPVIIIPGNHDIDEKNLHKPNIVEILTRLPQNVFTLNETGTYKLIDTYFITNSLQDAKFLYYKDIPKEIKKNKHVLLYHGAIIGSTTETYTINENGIGTRYRNKKDFNGYPLVLLGDIHKQQTIRTGMAYAGSLLQLTSNESIDKHGYLLWDFTGNYNFYEVPSNYKIVKFFIDNNEITNPELINVADNIIANFYYKNSNMSKIKDIIKNISQKCKNIFKTKEIKCLDQNNLNIDIESINVDHFFDQHSDIFSTLVKEHPLKNELIKYHLKILKDIELENTENTNWTIQNIEFKNCYSYGNDIVHKINLTNGLHHVTAKNASGKSSLFKIILYAIYGNNNNEIIVNNTVPFNIATNDQKRQVKWNKRMYTKINIKKDNKIYCITRYLDSIKDTKSIASDGSISFSRNNSIYKFKQSIEVFKILLNKKLERIMIINTKDAEKEINKLFGNYNNFISLNFINLNITDDFFSLKTTGKGNRNDYMSNIIGLGYFDKLAEISSQNSKGLNTIVSTLKNKETARKELIKDFDQKKYNKLISQIQEYKTKLNKLEQKYEKYIETNRKYHEDIIEMKDKLTDIPASFDYNINISTVKKQLQKYEKELENYNYETDFNIEILKMKLFEINIPPKFKIKNAKEKIKNIKIHDIPEHEIQEKNIQLTTKLLDFNIDESILPKWNGEKISDISKLQNKIINIKDNIEITKNNETIEEIEEEIEKTINNKNKLTNKIETIENDIQKLQCDTKYNDFNYKDLIAERQKLELGENNYYFYEVHDEELNKLNEIISKSKDKYNFTKADKIINKINNSNENTIPKKTIIKLVNEYNLLRENIIQYGEYYSIKNKLEQIIKKKKYNTLTKQINTCIKQNKTQEITKLKQDIENENNKLNILYPKKQYHIVNNNNKIFEKIKIIENYYSNQNKKNIENELKIINNMKEYYEIKNNIKNYKLQKELTTQMKFQEIKNNIKSSKEIIKYYEHYENNKNINNEINNTITEIKKTDEFIQETKDDIEKLQNVIYEINEEIKPLENIKLNISLIDNINEEESKYKEETEKTQELVKQYNSIVSTTSKNNVRNKIICDYMKKLEDKFNDIISKYINYRVNFNNEFQNDEHNMDIQFINLNKKMIATKFNNLSGYEQFICRLAFRIVLNMINTGPHTNCLFIDEAVEVIDTDNFAEKLPEICSLCNSYFNKVYIISQRPIELDTIPITKINIYKDPHTQFSSIKII